MPVDNFPGHAKTLNAPAHRWAAVTPNNSVDLPEIPKFIMASGAGVVSCVGSDDVEALVPIAAGVKCEVRPKRIRATGTTATGIVAFY